MSLPAPRRKRQRKKKSQSDDSIFIHTPTAPQAPVTTNRESAIVNSTAGVLFSAGRGIINGLTGIGYLIYLITQASAFLFGSSICYNLLPEVDYLRRLDIKLKKAF